MWKVSDWAKLALWILAVGGCITILLCAPLIWQWAHTWKPDPQSAKWLGYVFIALFAKWWLIDPIADRLHEIAEQMREFNRNYKWR